MTGKLGKLTFASLAATVALVALHGKAFIEALTAFPALLTAFASGLPFGVSSFLLAWALSGLFYSFVRRWLVCQRNVTRELGAQCFALCVGIGVCVAQQMTRDTGAPDLLQALWVGALAGLSSPLVVQALMAVLTDPEPPKTPLEAKEQPYPSQNDGNGE